jgi:hypothetical protein
VIHQQIIEPDSDLYDRTSKAGSPHDVSIASGESREPN